MYYYKTVDGKRHPSSKDDFDEILLSKTEWSETKSEIKHYKRLYEEAAGTLAGLVKGGGEADGWTVKSERTEYFSPHYLSIPEKMWRTVLISPMGAAVPPSEVLAEAKRFVSSKFGVMFVEPPKPPSTDAAYYTYADDVLMPAYNAAGVFDIDIGYQGEAWEVSVLHRNFLPPDSI